MSTVTRKCGCIRDLPTNKITTYCKEHEKFTRLDNDNAILADPVRAALNRIESDLSKALQVLDKVLQEVVKKRV